MNILLLRWSALSFVVGTFTVLTAGCVLYDSGYYDDGGADAAYYEPYGVVYGGWGPGYHVAPYRGEGHRPSGGNSHAPAHAYRSAPASRSMPSLPSRSRSGGSRSR
jgi:hypothetical protein